MMFKSSIPSPVKYHFGKPVHDALRITTTYMESFSHGSANKLLTIFDEQSDPSFFFPKFPVLLFCNQKTKHRHCEKYNGSNKKYCAHDDPFLR